MEDAQNRIPTNIADEMRQSYMDYAMSVIIGRALPDVRDGLKPANRRVLYGMQQMGLAPGKPPRKCAKIVGEVMGNYHPHGDASIYDTLVRMAQPFNLRVPLVDGQGNFGSIDGDPAAAQRYTEARLTKPGALMLADIEKETVDFQPTYDDSSVEPTVLPTALPNLLVNGAAGIAVGMATNIPPHNLSEVVDGLLYLLETDAATPAEKLEALMELIQGPDFPTAGFILGREGIRQAFRTGRGHHPDARAGGDRGSQGRPRVHRRHRDPLPGQQGPARRAHCRACPGQEDRGHHRHPRRVGPQGNAHRLRHSQG